MPPATFKLPVLTWKHACLLATASLLAFWLGWHDKIVEPGAGSEAGKSGTANDSAIGTVTAVFGPGAWTSSSLDSKDEKPRQTQNGKHPEDGLQLTDRGDLIPNLALLELMNAYLLKQGNANNSNALRDYLKHRLPSTAYQQASQILDNYLAYLKAHDDYLAAQNLSDQADNASLQNILRIASWRLQRERLRHRFLGEKITQAWYQNEDMQLKQAMAELLQRAGIPDSGAAQMLSLPQDEPSRPTAHWNDVAAEESYRLYLLGILNAAVRRLDN